MSVSYTEAPPKPHLTSERARELALLAAAKRRANAAQRTQLVANAELAMRQIKELAGNSDVLAETSDQFRIGVLARVRKQIESVLLMLEAEPEADEVDKLCRSLDKLMEQERKLAGRPLPGSLKPVNPKQTKYPSHVPEPMLMHEPQPSAEPALVVPPVVEEPL